jgi:hypothetical protein
MTTKMQSYAKAAATPIPSFTPVRRGQIQRKCACGGTPGPTGVCEECRKKRLQCKTRNSELGTRDDSFAPPTVHEVLRSPGQLLDGAARALMEPRFGHDADREFSLGSVGVAGRPHGVDDQWALAVGNATPLVHRYGVDSHYGFSEEAPAMTGEAGLDNPEFTAMMPEQAEDAVPTSGELPGSPSACVVQSAMPYSRSGIIRTSTGSVYEDFEVRVEWSSAKHRGEASYCAAECGEYHQFIKGYMRSSPNKDGSGLTDVSGKVFGGKRLDPNVFQEDGLDDNPKARYGHRNEKRTMNEKYEPDRATGTKYIGKDSPGVHIGTFADFDLTFVGRLVDTCSNTETVSDPWRVFYRGIIRP